MVCDNASHSFALIFGMILPTVAAMADRTDSYAMSLLTLANSIFCPSANSIRY